MLHCKMVRRVLVLLDGSPAASGVRSPSTYPQRGESLRKAAGKRQKLHGGCRQLTSCNRRCGIPPDQVVGIFGPPGRIQPVQVASFARTPRPQSRPISMGLSGRPLREHGWKAGHAFGRQEGDNALGDLGFIGRVKL
jgi:hypothetical protein